MKKLSILFIAGLLAVVGCKDDSLSPIITFDKASKGAYVRLLELITGEYDLSDIAGSNYMGVVEFVDEAQGGNVSSYDIYVSFQDNTPDNGDNSKDEILWNSFGQSNFADNERGYKQMDLTIPLTNVANALGLTNDQMAAGDFFNFRSELILTDGRKFTKANSSAAVNGTAFQGHFDFKVKATCPLPDTQFAGPYQIEYIEYEAGGVYGDAFGANPPIVQVTTVAGSSTLREFAWSYLPDTYNFDGQVTRFDFVCDQVQVSTTDTGVGCGSGTITIAENAPTPVDITDDSSFEMDLIEYATTGGCTKDGSGVMKLKFTKQ